jgi:hypothetical protein
LNFGGGVRSFLGVIFTFVRVSTSVVILPIIYIYHSGQYAHCDFSIITYF